jgi:hypothetical protein
MASVTAELIIEASANTDEAQQNLAQFNDRVALVTAALGIFAAGAVAAGVALVDFARQAAEEQEQVNRLAFALESAGVAAEQGLGRLDRFMLGASRATGFSDEQLREALTLFATYSAALEPAIGQIEDAGALIADIARQTGKSLPEVAMAVSKAFAGEATAIGELNPALRGAATEIMAVESAAIRGERAMGLLRDQFAGAAAETASAGTQMRVLANEFGDLQQTIGRAVLRSGEFSRALDTTLAALRDLDAELNDPSSGTSQNVENLGMLAEGTAESVSYLGTASLNFYNVAVDLTEATAAAGGALLAMTQGGDATEAAFVGLTRSVENSIGSMGEFFYELSGYSVDAAQDAESIIAPVEGIGFAWQFVTDAQERALSRGMQMIPGVRREAAELYESLRAFAFDGFEEPARAAAGPAAPENDEERKIKDSLVAVEEARRAAAEQQIADEQAKQQALFEIQKAAEEQRMEAERIANEQRVTSAKEASAAIVAAEIADAEKRAAIERELAQKRANIASLTANAAVGALDIILDGERKSGRERRKELGTFIAAQGRGYLLQAIPEAFLNPAKASTLAIGGAAMIGFGASLGGRVFGGSGGGGGGGGGSAGGSGFGAGGTGLSLPSTAPAQSQPVVVNDFAGAVVVANDPDSFRGVARRTDDARQSGLGGAL